MDAAYEAGGDDTAPEGSGDRTLVHFDREAPTLAEAITSALATVTRAGLQVIAVHTDDAK